MRWRHSTYSAPTDDIADAPQLGKLGTAEHCNAIHGRLGRYIETHESSCIFHSMEHLRDIARHSTGLGLIRCAFHQRTDLVKRLKLPAVVEPSLPRAHPPDLIGFNACIE